MPTPITSKILPVDVLIIGAGPAGLSCASGLSRLLHTCIVFSSEAYRNGKSNHMHGVLTWEHQDPADYRAAARKDILAHYDTVSFEDVGISSISKLEREDRSTLFKAVDEKGTEWWGRKVMLASGVKDIMLNIPGYEDCWVSGIFHCLFCHGYEERGAVSAGVLAIDDCSPAHLALHLARYANRLASKVTIYTHGNEDVTSAIEAAISQCTVQSKTRKNITIEPRKIAKLVKVGDKAEVEVNFEGGEKKTEGFLAHKPKGKLNGNWVEQLGLEVTPQGTLKLTPPFNETSSKGVFAGGDCGTPMQAATVALASGGACAAGLAAQLEAED